MVNHEVTDLLYAVGQRPGLDNANEKFVAAKVLVMDDFDKPKKPIDCVIQREPSSLGPKAVAETINNAKLVISTDDQEDRLLDPQQEGRMLGLHDRLSELTGVYVLSVACDFADNVRPNSSPAA